MAVGRAIPPQEGADPGHGTGPAGLRQRVRTADGRLEIAAHRPHVTVVDVRMPPTYTDEGLRAAIQLRREYPEVVSQLAVLRYLRS